MSQALYRKYRTTSLETTVGQNHITTLLARHIKHGTVSHAYLLTGPRGVGKTSIARIIAHEINKLPYDGTPHLDIIEIDAASNNGVEDVRDLREKVHIAPSSAAKKVYIIDEVHMLSKQAFNALLKTLEEPPEHVVFILATTDVDKLPATITSRTQRYNFRSISTHDAAKHLRTIADSESIEIQNDALELIAKHGDGSFRDSINLLDQLRHASDQTITVADVQAALGLTTDATINDLLQKYAEGNVASLAKALRELEASGVQPTILAKQLIDEAGKQAAVDPSFLPLLDLLLTVNSSSYPYVTLLTALGSRATYPVSTTATPPVNAPPKKPQSKTTSVSPVSDIPKPKETNQQDSPPQQASLTQPSELDWHKLLLEIKKTSAGLHTLLAKAGHAFNGSELTIFAGSSFAAKRLEDSKKLVVLQQALGVLGHNDLEVVVSASKKPPTDSQAASVAAIMGGGEEVDYSE